MITTKSIFIIIVTIAIVLVATTTIVGGNVYAQQQAPPLEENTPKATTAEPTQSLIGKITIPITATQQIIIDLPIKSDSKIEIVPIK
jgi:hypothetical protein